MVTSVEILSEKYVVFSVVGPHAGEPEEEILTRKIKEIHDAGKSFWLYKSYNARPDVVQEMCNIASRENKPIYVVFLEPASKGAAIATKSESVATQYSEDRAVWKPIPRGIRVKGAVRNAYALVLDELKPLELERVDLWDYSKFGYPSRAIRWRVGGSTTCAVRHSSECDPDKMERYRGVVAYGRLSKPFAVWLR